MWKRRRQGVVHVVAGDSPLTSESAASLAQALGDCLGEGPPQAVLELHHVPLLDSAGLETLLELQEQYQRRAGLIKLAAPNPLCLDILRATGVGGHFEIFPETKSAIGSFVQ